MRTGLRQKADALGLCVYVSVCLEATAQVNVFNLVSNSGLPPASQPKKQAFRTKTVGKDPVLLIVIRGGHRSHTLSVPLRGQPSVSRKRFLQEMQLAWQRLAYDFPLLQEVNR